MRVRLSFWAYQIATAFMGLFLPLILNRRIKSGKEDPKRINERYARSHLNREEAPLIWFHAASVGETKLALALFDTMRAQKPGLKALMTTQTLTAAHLVSNHEEPDIIHQMAPLDTPVIARRFIAQWQPQLALFIEGEIWPNLLKAASDKNIPLSLINARMTDKTRKNWMKRHRFAKAVFSQFSYISAANQETADWLCKLTDRNIDAIGNLKRVLPPPPIDKAKVKQAKTAFGERVCILAASTHEGEDELAFKAFQKIQQQWPKGILLLVPRHPERRGGIMALAEDYGFSSQLRSSWQMGDSLEKTDILICDTIGEMGNWIALADAIYLGGASLKNIGGHNPLEMTALGKSLVTGPYGYNFKDIFDELSAARLITIAQSDEEIAHDLAHQIQAPMEHEKLKAFSDLTEALLIEQASALLSKL